MDSDFIIIFVKTDIMNREKTSILIILLPLFLMGFVHVAFAQRKQTFTVVIDPGHGGKDPGAIGSMSKEKDIVLSVAKKLGEKINSSHSDVKVVYTRTTDKFIALDERPRIANRAHAQLFISIHANALDRRKRSPQGVETYILGLHRSQDNLEVAKRENSVIVYEDNYETKYQGFNPEEPESYIIFEFMSNKFLEESLNFATLTQHELINGAKRTNRDVRQAGFLVLRETGMPSVLIELGYITNREEEKYMNSEQGQKALVNSIYDAFTKYKADYDKRNGYVNMANSNPTSASSNDLLSDPTSELQNDSPIEYKVQFLTASRLYKANTRAFKGLDPVEYYKEGSVYKYTHGSTSNEKEIISILNKVKTKFKDAFVVQFKDGQRIK
ncbi:MAG: N-acetylmuramoyl-L-alanine amidase [Dysgonamonadaceae bacterium]|jgi:N-acetylmuramoyl-L-alanine amidase|nr:N-acetylmuramoyl-L-alanine amidase [Dysgonamonadaceae bacterium]